MQYPKSLAVYLLVSHVRQYFEHKLIELTTICQAGFNATSPFLKDYNTASVTQPCSSKLDKIIFNITFSIILTFQFFIKSQTTVDLS